MRSRILTLTSESSPVVEVLQLSSLSLTVEPFAQPLRLRTHASLPLGGPLFVMSSLASSNTYYYRLTGSNARFESGFVAMFSSASSITIRIRLSCALSPTTERPCLLCLEDGSEDIVILSSRNGVIVEYHDLANSRTTFYEVDFNGTAPFFAADDIIDLSITVSGASASAEYRNLTQGTTESLDVTITKSNPAAKNLNNADIVAAIARLFGVPQGSTATVDDVPWQGDFFSLSIERGSEFLRYEAVSSGVQVEYWSTGLSSAWEDGEPDRFLLEPGPLRVENMDGDLLAEVVPGELRSWWNVPVSGLRSVLISDAETGPDDLAIPHRFSGDDPSELPESQSVSLPNCEEVLWGLVPCEGGSGFAFVTDNDLSQYFGNVINYLGLSYIVDFVDFGEWSGPITDIEPDADTPQEGFDTCEDGVPFSECSELPDAQEDDASCLFTTEELDALCEPETVVVFSGPGYTISRQQTRIEVTFHRNFRDNEDFETTYALVRGCAATYEQILFEAFDNRLVAEDCDDPLAYLEPVPCPLAEGRSLRLVGERSCCRIGVESCVEGGPFTPGLPPAEGLGITIQRVYCQNERFCGASIIT